MDCFLIRIWESSVYSGYSPSIFFLNLAFYYGSFQMFTNCVNQGSPEKQNNRVWKIYYWGVGSWDYGGWESPLIICKRKAQESQWCNLLWSWRPENQGSWERIQGQEKMWCQLNREAGKRDRSPPLPFILYIPSRDWTKLSHLRGSSLLYWVYNSNANLTWNHPHRHA